MFSTIWRGPTGAGVISTSFSAQCLLPLLPLDEERRQRAYNLGIGRTEDDRACFNSFRIQIGGSTPPCPLSGRRGLVAASDDRITGDTAPSDITGGIPGEMRLWSDPRGVGFPGLMASNAVPAYAGGSQSPGSRPLHVRLGPEWNAARSVSSWYEIPPARHEISLMPAPEIAKKAGVLIFATTLWAS